MTEFTFTVDVSEETARRLDDVDDAQIEGHLASTLREWLESSDEKREELRQRRDERLGGTDPDSSDEEESVSAEEQRQQLREYLHGDRQDGIEKR